MPFYKFKCKTCNNEFQKKMSMSEASEIASCSCGEDAIRDYGQVNLDDTNELRDPKSARYWRKNMSQNEQSKVLAGEKDPY
tara:strand:- start:21047 stop:21289 length:243 start_codon:yes stop_codon:yes gene_type:complete